MIQQLNGVLDGALESLSGSRHLCNLLLAVKARHRKDNHFCLGLRFGITSIQQTTNEQYFFAKKIFNVNQCKKYIWHIGLLAAVFPQRISQSELAAVVSFIGLICGRRLVDIALSSAHDGRVVGVRFSQCRTLMLENNQSVKRGKLNTFENPG